MPLVRTTAEYRAVWSINVRLRARSVSEANPFCYMGFSTQSDIAQRENHPVDAVTMVSIPFHSQTAIDLGQSIQNPR